MGSSVQVPAVSIEMSASRAIPIRGILSLLAFTESSAINGATSGALRVISSYSTFIKEAGPPFLVLKVHGFPPYEICALRPLPEPISNSNKVSTNIDLMNKFLLIIYKL